MKKDWKNILLFLIWILLIVAVLVPSIFLEPQEIINNIIQSVSIVTLVFVTGLYARHTKELANQARTQASASIDQIQEIKMQTWKTAELVEIQRLVKDLEFSERRLRFLYNPYISCLDNLIMNFDKKTISESNSELIKSHIEIFYPHTYMMSKETVQFVGKLIVDFGESSREEDNKELSDEDKSQLFRSLTKIRNALHEERMSIEDYISENYPFPEKKLKRS